MEEAAEADDDLRPFFYGCSLLAGDPLPTLLDLSFVGHLTPLNWGSLPGRRQPRGFGDHEGGPEHT